MKIGLSLPQAGVNATRENVIKFAQAAEKENFDSLWVLERLLYPINPQTKYPGSADGMMPEEWKNIYDPINLLSFVAANTNKILLGTGVIDVLFHNPVVLGREFATLDVLSQGRTIAGLGIGWLKDEYQTSNVPFERRGARQDEFIQAMKRVWTDDVVEFHGKFYNIPASKIGPKPVQKPHPKILLGGFSPKTFQRIAKYANGWLGVVGVSIEQLGQIIQAIRQEVEKAGKNPDEFEMSTLAHPHVNQTSLGEKRMPMTGTIEEIGSDIAKLKEVGFNRVVLSGSAGKGFSVEKRIELAKDLSKFVN